MEKISILMPTYNDCNTITESLDTVRNQTYKNWELIICNDGSTDNTKEKVTNYINKKKDKRIKLVNQENKDQLNAIINAAKYSSGDYYYILHSDDLLSSNDFLEKAINFMHSNEGIDGFYCDLLKIDKNGNTFDSQVIKKYQKRKSTIALQLLMYGRNMYVDFAFITRETFFNEYMNNYLLWNGPFWLCIDSNRMLNIMKAPFPSIKYRVFEENYANNLLGRLCVFNGEVRVFISLMKNYNIPLYNLQYFFFRVYRKLNLLHFFRVFYRNEKQKNKYTFIKKCMYSSFSHSEISENVFLNSLLHFYKNEGNGKSITLKHDFVKKIELYYGKDMRLFNRRILNNTLSWEYKYILSEMKKGFSTIILEDKKDLQKVKDICRFLCIVDAINFKINSKKKRR